MRPPAPAHVVSYDVYHMLECVAMSPRLVSPVGANPMLQMVCNRLVVTAVLAFTGSTRSSEAVLIVPAWW